MNYESIAQFSKKDADAYVKYELFLSKVRDILQPILDNPLPDVLSGPLQDRLMSLNTIRKLLFVSFKNRDVLLPFYELLLSPAATVLDKWFESDILKATLATDSVIGALVSPYHNGSAYVLLHHVMGEALGKKGVWAYVEGGMGQISESIAHAAREYGAEIVTGVEVEQILTDANGGRTSLCR